MFALSPLSLFPGHNKLSPHLVTPRGFEQGIGYPLPLTTFPGCLSHNCILLLRPKLGTPRSVHDNAHCESKPKMTRSPNLANPIHLSGNML
jgi:hypothetical protein